MPDNLVEELQCFLDIPWVIANASDRVPCRKTIRAIYIGQRNGNQRIDVGGELVIVYKQDRSPYRHHVPGGPVHRIGIINDIAVSIGHVSTSQEKAKTSRLKIVENLLRGQRVEMLPIGGIEEGAAA